MTVDSMVTLVRVTVDGVLTLVRVTGETHVDPCQDDR